MAQKPTPELYLWLLSGRPGSVSRISQEERSNGVESRLSDPGGPFLNDPDRLVNLLDAIAALCVQKEKAEVFFVSLSMDSTGATIYVASNEAVPLSVISHLHEIQTQLKKLKAVLEYEPLTSESETSPDSSVTPLRTASELGLQKLVYTYSYRKLRQRFSKRGPKILDQYDNIIKSLKDISHEEADLLDGTHNLLRLLQHLLEDEEPPHGPDLIKLVETIDLLNKGWRQKIGDKVLAKWEATAEVNNDSRTLSLRCFFEKLFTIHHHIKTVTRIVWSHRLSPVLTGNFRVVAVPPAHTNISIKFSHRDVSSIVFPPGDCTNEDRKAAVCTKLLKRMQEKAEEQGIDFKVEETVPEVSLSRVHIHAEVNLLAYHLQRADHIHPYSYFGGSKLSCHSCTTLFSSFNRVAESFQCPQYFTRGCHDNLKIYLRWACPSLWTSMGQCLDSKVREGMTAVLSTELAKYVQETRVVIQSDSTAASSGESHESKMDIITQIKAQGDAADVELKRRRLGRSNSV